MKCPRCHSDNPDTSQYCGECGTQLIPSEDVPLSHTKTLKTPKEIIKRGTVFAGRYEVIEELGKGGMGEVYRVFDNKIGEEVTLKLVRPEIAADGKTIERFRNELKYARKISHKNVCRMYDLHDEEGTPYITMEYVPGEDLKSMMAMAKQISAETTVSIAKQICEGLAEAHRLGVVHRDLKPNNIMIDKKGNARIMDFGIARSLEAEGITGDGSIIGTPEYMSPEQAEGMEADHRSDIYSFGVILYEMVTGKVPFEGDTPLSIALKHKREIPHDPRKYNPQVPSELSSLILKCLEKDKEKRFQSAEEMLSELNNIKVKISTMERILQKKKVVSPKEKKAASRKQWMIVSVLCVTIVIIGISVLYFMGKKPVIPSERDMLVVLPFENLGSAEDEYFADGITDEITSRLAALQGLGIISRTSAVQYRKTDKTIRQIGEELGVDFVLEGSVRWNKIPEGRGRVRVTPQLVRVADDTHIWSESYDRDIEDIFSVQTEIAENVARQLDLTVLEPERRALNTNPTENLRAYDCYLQGREHEDKGWAYSDPQEFELAIEMLEKAAELDPGFALPYVRMSYIHSRMYFFGVDRTEERLAKSKAAVDRALELQPDLPEAHRSLAFYYYWGLSEYDQAAEIFESVQKARPNFDPQVLGYIQRRQGRWEQCVETLERAFRISPLDTQIAYELGGANLSMRRYDEAEKWFNRVLNAYPDHLPAQLGKVAIYVLSKGNTEGALALLETLPQHKLKDYMWFTLNMLERNYKDVLDWLSSLSYDSFEDQHFYFQKNLAFASVYYAMKDLALMKSHAESACIPLEKAVNEHAADPRFHAALGLAYAYLGRKEEAIQEGDLAARLHPVSKDAAQGPIYLLNLARIYTVAGEYERAIDQLEYLLSVPHAEYLWQLVSVPQLKLDPQWDSLRGHPRFEHLLEER
jgi:serine/threonine protein kinase/tetratricopeptide (TPR) repeat protein